MTTSHTMLGKKWAGMAYWVQLHFSWEGGLPWKASKYQSHQAPGPRILTQALGNLGGVRLLFLLLLKNI